MARAMSEMFRISLPDGSVREVAAGTTPADCFALLKASGPRGRISVMATAAGLSPGTVNVEAVAR